MKKLLVFAAIAAFSITAVKGQIEKPVRVIKKVPVPPSNNAPVSTVQYYLSSAKVNIFTGNDNKELPSIVTISLYRLSTSLYATGAGDGTTYLFNYSTQGDHKQEFRPNSDNQIVLTNGYSFPYTFPGGTGEGYRFYELGLGLIQTNGLRLRIDYSPNFILDAWKIEKVILTLEFKDLNGNPHPTMATVTIPFLKSALLKDGNNVLICETDKFLMPKS